MYQQQAADLLAAIAASETTLSDDLAAAARTIVYAASSELPVSPLEAGRRCLIAYDGAGAPTLAVFRDYGVPAHGRSRTPVQPWGGDASPANIRVIDVAQALATRHLALVACEREGVPQAYRRIDWWSRAEATYAVLAATAPWKIPPRRDTIEYRVEDYHDDIFTWLGRTIATIGCWDLAAVLHDPVEDRPAHRRVYNRLRRFVGESMPRARLDLATIEQIAMVFSKRIAWSPYPPPPHGELTIRK